MRLRSKNLNLLFEQEIPSGTVNGLNGTFTLAQTPYSQKAVMIWQNGLMLLYGVHFTVVVATKTITFVTPPPQGSDLIATYLRSN